MASKFYSAHFQLLALPHSGHYWPYWCRVSQLTAVSLDFLLKHYPQYLYACSCLADFFVNSVCWSPGGSDLYNSCSAVPCYETNWHWSSFPVFLYSKMPFPMLHEFKARDNESQIYNSVFSKWATCIIKGLILRLTLKQVVFSWKASWLKAILFLYSRYLLLNGWTSE